MKVVVIGYGVWVFIVLGRKPKVNGGVSLVLIVSIFIVPVGGSVFQTHPLSTRTWLQILLITSPVLMVREVWYQLRRRRR